MTLLRTTRILVRPRYRLNWVTGRRRADGFVWYVRGTNFSTTHEDWLRAEIHPFSGDLFVDIGAHIGTWAVRATKTFSQVIAFEPNIGTNRMLRTTVKMNKLPNISVRLAALSNIGGEMVVSARNRASRHVQEHQVPVRTLDSFKLKPTLVKIDTEGDELPVLQGSEETLKERPRIVVETHSTESLRATKEFLEARGYLIREIRRENRFNQIQSWLLCN